MRATYKFITESDIGVVVSMMQEFYAIDNYPINPELSKKLFIEFIADAKLGKAWLISTENGIAGYVILTFVFSFEYGGTIAFLDELFLKEEARGKGIGRQTIGFIQREAGKSGLKLIYLEVEPNNEKAQRLYLSSDFEMHNRKFMKYKTNDKT